MPFRLDEAELSPVTTATRGFRLNENKLEPVAAQKPATAQRTRGFRIDETELSPVPDGGQLDISTVAQAAKQGDFGPLSQMAESWLYEEDQLEPPADSMSDMWAPRPIPQSPAKQAMSVSGEDSVPKPSPPQPVGRSQFSKSLETGGENVISGLLGTLTTTMRAGQNMPGKWYPDSPEQRAETEQTAQKLDQWAQMLYEDAQRPEMMPKKGSGPWQYVQHVTGNTLPFMTAALAGGYALGPAGAFMVSAAVEGDNAYRDAIAAGADEQTAQIERVLVGTLNGTIEQMQIGGLLKVGKTSAPLLKRIARSAAAKSWKKLGTAVGKLTAKQMMNAANEGLEESLQEMVSIGAARIHGDTIEIGDDAMRVLGAGLGGFTAGGLLGGASVLTESAQQTPELRPANAPPYQGEAQPTKTLDQIVTERTADLPIADELAAQMIPVVETPVPTEVQSDSFTKDEVDSLKSLGYRVGAITTMDVTDGRRRIRDGVRAEPERPAPVPQSGPGVVAEAAQAVAAPAAEVPASAAEEVTPVEGRQANARTKEAFDAYWKEVGEEPSGDTEGDIFDYLSDADEEYKAIEDRIAEIDTGPQAGTKQAKAEVIRLSNQLEAMRNELRSDIESKQETKGRKEAHGKTEAASIEIGPTSPTVAGGESAATSADPAQPEGMTFDDFSASRGVSSTPPSFPELHRTPRRPSKQSQKAAAERVSAAMDEWGNQREVLRAEYNRLVEQGKIRQPSRIEKLIATAQGNEDNESVLAARRILEKEGVSWNQSFPTPSQRDMPAETQAATSETPTAISDMPANSDPTIDLPSAQGGFIGGRPGAARATVSAITRENMSTGSKNADSFLKRTKGYGWTKSIHPLKKAMASAARFVRAFRFLPSLPKTMEFAKVREAFRQVMEVPKLAYDTATERMKWALKPVEGTSAEARKRLEAVRLKLIADDLMEDVDSGVALPEGIEEADVQAMKQRADELYEKYPTVRETYDRLRQVVKEHTDMLVEEGWLDPERAREMYFPHKVIKYLRQNDGFFGVGRKPAVPRKGYLKQRKGGVDYSTDVLERLIEHWAEVQRDIQTVRFIEKVYKQEQKDFLAKYPDWKQGEPLPNGYREQVILPGRFYYRTGGVTEDLATALMAQDLAAIQEILEAKDENGTAAVRKVLAMGKKRSYIVREEVAQQTLDMPTAPVSDHPLYRAIASFNTFTKRQILFNALYAIPFHGTNFVGDAHKVFVALPGALKSEGMVGYWLAIRAAHAGHKPTLFAEAQKRGVIGSGWLGVDVKNVEAMIPELERAEVSGGLKDIENKAKRLYNATKALGQSREDWLRYATFKYLVDQQNKGVDITRFAVKDVQVVKGLEGYDKAAKIARDIMGDYAAIGKSGIFLSDTVAPFYRWMHLNTPWWPRMIAEYAKRGEAGRMTAAMIAAMSPYVLAMLWNYSDDERRKIEEKLPHWKRWNFHVIVGGKAWSIPLPTDDLLNFLGIPENIADFQSYQKGLIDFQQLVGRIAANMAYSPGTAVVNSVGGALGVTRDLFGFKTFPEIADYRIKKWDKRAMNALKTVFGAPAQIAEAAARDDNAKVSDLMWRSFMPARPWTMTSDPIDALANITYDKDQQDRPLEPLSWKPHAGKTVDVDRLKAQIDKLSPKELQEAKQRRADRKEQERMDRWKKKFPKMSDAELRKLLSQNTYKTYSKPSMQTGWAPRIPGQATKGNEELVKQIRAELARRKDGR